MKNILLSLIFSIFLLNSNILFLFFDTSFIVTQFQKQGVYEYFNGKVVPDNKYEEIKSFLFGEQSLSVFFDAREKAHLNDVKNIIQDMIKIEIALTLTFICLLIFISKEVLIKAVITSSVINLFLIFLSLLVFINFEYFFSGIFHPLLFRNDYWQLDENSNLLHLTPYGFYLEAYKIILFRLFLISIGIIITRKSISWRQSKNK